MLHLSYNDEITRRTQQRRNEDHRMGKLHDGSPHQRQPHMQHHFGRRYGTQVQILEDTADSDTVHVHGNVPGIPQKEPVRYRDFPTAREGIHNAD